MWRVTDLVGWPALGVFGIIFAPFRVGDMISLRLGVGGGVVGVGPTTVLADNALVSTMMPLARLFCLTGAAGSFFDCLRGGAGGGAAGGGGGAGGAADEASGMTGAVSVGTGGSFFRRDTGADDDEARLGLVVASTPRAPTWSKWSTAIPESAESVREKDTFRSAGGPFGPPSPPAIVAGGELVSHVALR